MLGFNKRKKKKTDKVIKKTKVVADKALKDYGRVSKSAGDLAVGKNPVKRWQ